MKRVLATLVAASTMFAVSPALQAQAVGPVLKVASPGDGDSWKGSDNRTYRLAMVNAPDKGECFVDQATHRRRQLTANGFRLYQTTNANGAYNRTVGVLVTREGVDIGLVLTREGLVNDKYLEQYRKEAPAYASKLKAEMDKARAAKRGLWGRCGYKTAANGSREGQPAAKPKPAASPAAQPSSSSRCHPAYATCIPVKGNGSGSGAANDLDCPDIRRVVRLKSVGNDPYRLDSNRDGVGCESYA